MGLLFGLLQTDEFQTWLARRVTSYLSGELNAKVKVQRVSIRFFNKVVLGDVFVADTKGDSLFYFNELSVDIKDLSFEKKNLDISKITLHDGYFNLIHSKGELHDNLFFLTDYFSSKDSTVKDTSKWNLKLRNIELKNFRFHYDDWNDPEEKGLVDFSHLDVSHVSGFFHDLRFVNDSIFAKIDKLSFKEKSGFIVNEFTADAKVSDHEITTKGLLIKSPTTDLDGNLNLNYTSWDDFSDFIHKVKWTGDFNRSRSEERRVGKECRSRWSPYH